MGKKEIGMIEGMGIQIERFADLLPLFPGVRSEILGKRSGKTGKGPAPGIVRERRSGMQIRHPPLVINLPFFCG